MPDHITPETLQPYLSRERLPQVLCFSSTDSTNLRLKEHALQNGVTHGLVAIANEQTAGRGRLGRSFSTRTQQGVYLSILLDPAQMGPVPSLSSWTALTSWAAVASCNAIEEVYGIRPQIKWVNDLVLNGRKAGGILTEMETDGDGISLRNIILGIGINVQEKKADFPEELQETATSLLLETRKRIPRAQLAAALIRHLDCLCTDWPAAQPQYLAQYRNDSLVIGKKIRVLSGEKEQKALALSIGEDFSLHVRYANGETDDLRGGEISIRPST